MPPARFIRIVSQEVEALPVNNSAVDQSKPNDPLRMFLERLKAAVRVWERRYNGPGNRDDSASAIAVDACSGNVLVTGTSSGGRSTGWDYATIKYSNAGVPLWTRRYDGPAGRDDIATGLAFDPNGNVLVFPYAIHP